jgi:hypothetical protein
LFPAFAERVADGLARIPGVQAVALGGSRALGDHRPDSDWDFGLYYRGELDPDHVRALGWPGQVFAPGDWGGGVMNGGAWLEMEGQRVDVIYRDLTDVEHWIAEAEQGRFRVERLPFYLAGIPTYVVVGELAVNRVLVGDLPRPGYPRSLQAAARDWWHTTALLTVDYAQTAYAARGDPIGCAGALARAVVEAAHGVLAGRGEWALNEKRIVERSGLDGLAGRFARLGMTPGELRTALDAVRAAIQASR